MNDLPTGSTGEFRDYAYKIFSDLNHLTTTTDKILNQMSVMGEAFSRKIELVEDKIEVKLEAKVVALQLQINAMSLNMQSLKLRAAFWAGGGTVFGILAGYVLPLLTKKLGG